MQVAAEQWPSNLSTIADYLRRRECAYESQDEALAFVTQLAVVSVPGSTWASIASVREGRMHTLAATGEPAREADALQDRSRTGPAIDAAMIDGAVRTPDLRSDPNWSLLGQTTARSTMSVRMTNCYDDSASVLNFYADRADRFDDTSEAVALVTAIYGGTLVAAAAAREQNTHLQRALLTNRDIGTAIGVLMAQLKLPRDEALLMLQEVSQRTNRRVADIAGEVVDTGTLDLRPEDTSRGASVDDQLRVT